MSARETVPTFYLYGESPRIVADDFLHAEDLDHRSRPAGWLIQAHAHRELNHLILITKGGGRMEAEGATATFEAPCLLLVPAGVIHGFHWHDESEGSVLTIANSQREELIRRHPAFGTLFAAAAAAPLDRAASDLIDGDIRRLIRELGWAAPGHKAAVEAALLGIGVQALRGLAGRADGTDRRPSRQAELVARFRAVIEERFRLREPIAGHAARLGVSATTLRVACARTAGASPGQILDMRALLEAKRALRYTDLSVAEIAYGLGFTDPAYFSRMFARNLGCSPRQFRHSREGGAAG